MPAPDVTSTMLSSPKPIREMDPAIAPATIETSPSKAVEGDCEVFESVGPCEPAHCGLMWWWSRLPESMKPVKPFTNLFERRLQFLFHFRRHSSRLREEAEHVGIALLGTRKGPFGVFPVAHAVRCFSNGGQREAHAQVGPDEIKACLFDFIPKTHSSPHIRVKSLRYAVPPTGTCHRNRKKWWPQREHQQG